MKWVCTLLPNCKEISWKSFFFIFLPLSISPVDNLKNIPPVFSNLILSSRQCSIKPNMCLTALGFEWYLQVFHFEKFNVRQALTWKGCWRVPQKDQRWLMGRQEDRLWKSPLLHLANAIWFCFIKEVDANVIINTSLLTRYFLRDFFLGY